MEGSVSMGQGEAMFEEVKFDENKNPFTPDTINLAVYEPTTSDSERLYLSETADTSGIFLTISVISLVKLT